MKYTIYHIPGVKVGCTKRSVTKRVNEQGYTEYEVLGVYTDINEAAEREREFQLQLGYGLDCNELYNERYIANGIKTASINKKSGHLDKIQIEGGRVQGNINKQTGHIQKIQLENAKNPKKSWKTLYELNQQYKTCPHCNMVTRAAGYNRWHGDKCKQR